MFKRVFVLIIALITILTVSSCAEDAASEDALSIMMKQSDSDTDYVERIIASYEEKTGNEIAVIAIPNDEFDSAVEQAFESGNLPDLLFHYNDSILASYGTSHFYYMNGQPWKDELMEDVYKSCLDSEGNLLGLPFWENSLSGCYYNKTILDNLGLTPSATQQEFNMLCTALTTVGETPLYWAANDCNWMFQFGLDPIFANDPELLEKLNSNQITYADIPEVVSMVEWFDEANKMGWFNKDYAGLGWDDVAPAMASGEAVMIPVWDTWFETTLDKVEDGRYTSADFAVMPIFFGTIPEGTYEGGNLNILLVNKDSPHVEEALEFLDFCALPENYNEAFDGVPTVNVFKNQTTNVQSEMVTDAMPSIEAHRTPSTAVPMIIGYTQNGVGEAFKALFDGEVDVTGCIAIMDENRIAEAKAMGAEGF